jgi:hypothetical protein
LISRQSSFKDSKYSMKQQHNHQICTTPSRKIRAIAGLCKKVHATEILDYGTRWQNNDTSPDQRSDSRTDNLTFDPKGF